MMRCMNQSSSQENSLVLGWAFIRVAPTHDGHDLIGRFVGRFVGFFTVGFLVGFLVGNRIVLKQVAGGFADKEQICD